MAVVFPCAGRSSRYPGERPKYLLTMYDGELMIQKSCNGYVGNSHLRDEDVHFIILKQHDDEFDAARILEHTFDGNCIIHILDDVTSGPAETVYQVSKGLNNRPLFIADCDSFFDAPIRHGNYVCVGDLRDNLDLYNVAAKSFVQTTEQGMVTNIVEKNVIGNLFCAGGYSFASTDDYNRAYKELRDRDSEVFVSHVIKHLLSDLQFDTQKVSDFVDCGTYKEFAEYNYKRILQQCS